MESTAMRRGDLVEVRGPKEILATLDEFGRLDGVPFMPEMVAYCGRRFVTDCRANKICDTVKYTGSRSLPDTVLLADLRCDGSGHDGCQAECRLYWKEAWLRKVAVGDPVPAAAVPEDLQLLKQYALRHVKRKVTVDQAIQEKWCCQATQLNAASQYVKLWDPRPYLGQYVNGNVSLGRCLRISARAAVEEPLRRLGLKPLHLRGTSSAPATELLNLQPGEWVRVRSMKEILPTLNARGFNKGLWFDREMAAYCGGTYRVKRRITRFINEAWDDGRMVEMKSDAIVLEHVQCTGDLSPRRWFCPRQAIPYWRECWLERAAAPDGLD